MIRKETSITRSLLFTTLTTQPALLYNTRVSSVSLKTATNLSTDIHPTCNIGDNPNATGPTVAAEHITSSKAKTQRHQTRKDQTPYTISVKSRSRSLSLCNKNASTSPTMTNSTTPESNTDGLHSTPNIPVNNKFMALMNCFAHKPSDNPSATSESTPSNSRSNPDPPSSDAQSTPLQTKSTKSSYLPSHPSLIYTQRVLRLCPSINWRQIRT